MAKSAIERERIKEYRQAVAEARDGKVTESFDRLDKQGAIVQCTLADQHEKLAQRYLELAQTKQSTVIVSQSWNEIHKVNEQIRAALQREKLIGEKQTILFKHLDRLTVCERKDLALSAGDRLQLKANGRSENKSKLANGELVTVKQVYADGHITLADGRVLPKSFRQFVRGYAVTSYAAQGKSVNHVLFSDSALKAATNQQQWYVTISRGKKGITIFTTDKHQLREQIARSGDRPLAVDLVGPGIRNSWFYRLAERRWGKRAAQIMELRRRARISESLRQRAHKFHRRQLLHSAGAPRHSRSISV